MNYYSRCSGAALIALFGVALALSPAEAQVTLDNPRGEMIPVTLSSPADLNTSRLEPGEPAFIDELHIAGSAWIRVFFDEVTLSPGSFVRLTAPLDGESQDLDSAALAMWENSSAFFNGDTLVVELFAAPGSIGNRLSISQALIERGEALSPADFCGICNGDSRTPSDQPWAGRLMPVGCTATIYSPNSCIVSAGHCVSSNLVMQFNVPASNSDCTLRNPPVEDQFPVTSSLYENAGVGNDWAVMSTGVNNIAQTIYDRYATYMPIAYGPARANDSANVWGYAIDDECTRTQTQQDANGGTILTVGPTQYTYNIDVTFGNSGSSIIRNNEIIGIVTHCSNWCQNFGTRIDAQDFVSARQSLCNDVDRTLRLEAPVPGLAGQRNSITATGCRPGESVNFYYGRGTNFVPVPGCPDLFLDINNPVLASVVTADANGSATASGSIPGSLSGSSLLFQVSTPDTCRVSNLVVARFP